MMRTKVNSFFNELKKYEADGTDSMDWAEWARDIIDETIVKCFNNEDWSFIKDTYKNKSDNMKSLITGHIHLTNINFAEIQLQILTEMVKTAQIDVAYNALTQIIFGFVTAGVNYDTNLYYNKKELKGIFLSDKKDYLIKNFFTLNFKTQAMHIANACGEIQRNTILKFLKLIDI